MGGTLLRGPSGTPAMEGDGAEEVEVLKHRKEGHVMNEDRGVRRESAANIGRDIERAKGKGQKAEGERREGHLWFLSYNPFAS